MMALKLFRDLLSMAFRVFNQKSFPVRQKNDRSSQEPLGPPKQMMQLYLDCGNTSHWPKNRPVPHLSPGPLLKPRTLLN